MKIKIVISGMEKKTFLCRIFLLLSKKEKKYLVMVDDLTKPSTITRSSIFFVIISFTIYV